MYLKDQSENMFSGFRGVSSRRYDSKSPPFTYLWLRHHGVLPIAEWWEVEALLLLLVPLLEELLHAPEQPSIEVKSWWAASPGGPLVMKLPLLCCVSNVCRVEEETKHPRLVKAGGKTSLYCTKPKLVFLAQNPKLCWKLGKYELLDFKGLFTF